MILSYTPTGLIILLVSSWCRLSLSAVIHPPPQPLSHTVDFVASQANLHVVPEDMRVEPLSVGTEAIRRNSYETTEPHQSQPTGSESKLNQAVFYAEPYQKMSPSFENIPAPYIGPNYGFNSGHNTNYEESIEKSSQAANPFYQLMSQVGSIDQSSNSQKQPDTMNDMLTSTFKKYNVKKYLLKKILGSSHELDEDEGGFFSNKHLKRHGTAGVAAKVLGELIGIKIRESIEGLGKSFSEYAKDFTARNFVSLGNTFSRMFKLH